MYLAYAENYSLYLEGRSTNLGRPCSPMPIVTPAGISCASESPLETLPGGPFIGDQKLLFREDFFDAVSRVRRGRLYIYEDQKVWLAGDYSGSIRTSPIATTSSTFRSLRASNAFPDFPAKQYTIALGSTTSATLWTLLSAEMISSGEDLITLKARSTLGSLPELVTHNIPSADKGAIEQAYRKLSDDIYRAGPESIVDHCRDLAEWLLRAKLREQDPQYEGKNLDELIRDFRKVFKDFRNVPNCAEAIRILHQRRKTEIQDTKPVRQILSQDGELAVHCVGSTLCDLGWGRWM